MLYERKVCSLLASPGGGTPTAMMAILPKTQAILDMLPHDRASQSSLCKDLMLASDTGQCIRPVQRRSDGIVCSPSLTGTPTASPRTRSWPRTKGPNTCGSSLTSLLISTYQYCTAVQSSDQHNVACRTHADRIRSPANSAEAQPCAQLGPIQGCMAEEQAL